MQHRILPAPLCTLTKDGCQETFTTPTLAVPSQKHDVLSPVVWLKSMHVNQKGWSNTQYFDVLLDRGNIKACYSALQNKFKQRANSLVNHNHQGSKLTVDSIFLKCLGLSTEYHATAIPRKLCDSTTEKSKGKNS